MANAQLLDNYYSFCFPLLSFAIPLQHENCLTFQCGKQGFPCWKMYNI